MTLLIETSAFYAQEQDYILSIIFGDFLGLHHQRVSTERPDIRITIPGHAGELRMPNILFSLSRNEWLTPASIPSQPLSFWDCGELELPVPILDSRCPIIYGDLQFSKNSLSFQSAACRERSIWLPLDVLGSAFFMLTRYEEIVKTDRDEHSRFPAHAALAFQESFLLRPIIDEYVEVLWAAFKCLWPSLKRRKQSYKLILTHDVDRPFGVKGEPWHRITRRFGGDLLRRKNPGMAFRRAGSCIFPGKLGERLDPNNTFDWIMDQSERYGLQSEFYFMAGSTSKYDGGYDVFSQRVQRLLDRIHKRGHVIGFHPSYGTLGRPEQLSYEAETLRRAMDEAGVVQELKGGRQHYLRWQAEHTWSDLENAGLKEDSSVGFVQHVGFRSGTSRSYPAWSWQKRKILKLTERPLIAMEGSLLYRKHMALNWEESISILKRLAKAIALFGGEFVLLWHNDFLINSSDVLSYQMILEEIAFDAS